MADGYTRALKATAAFADITSGRVPKSDGDGTFSDATTANLPDSTNARYMSDAQETGLDLVNAEYSAGSRGLRHLTALYWAPTADAQSHDFAVSSAAYTYLEIRANGLGKTGLADSYELQPDGSITGCSSDVMIVSGTTWTNYTAAANAFIAFSSGVGCTTVVQLFRLQDGTWTYISHAAVPGGSNLRRQMSGNLPTGWTSLRILAGTADFFQANVSKIQLWGIPA